MWASDPFEPNDGMEHQDIIHFNEKCIFITFAFRQLADSEPD